MAGDCPGCPTTKDLADEQHKIKIDTAVHAERLSVAAARVEKSADAFDRCLAAIEAHSLSLTVGKGEMTGLRVDINRVAKKSRITDRCLGVGLAVIYLVVLASPLGHSLLTAMGHLMGIE